MVRRSRLSRSDGKPRSTRMNKLFEIAKFAGHLLNEYDVRDVQRKALHKKFEEKHGTYLSDGHFKDINENLPIERQFALLEESVLGKHGSVEKYKLDKEYENLHHYLGVRSSVLKGSQVINLRHWSGVFVTLPADVFYNFAHHVLKGKYLRDYAKVHSEFTDKQIEEYYSPKGVVKTDLFTMKRFMNGRIDVTFNDAASAKKVHDALLKLESERR